MRICFSACFVDVRKMFQGDMNINSCHSRLSLHYKCIYLRLSCVYLTLLLSFIVFETNGQSFSVNFVNDTIIDIPEKYLNRKVSSSYEASVLAEQLVEDLVANDHLEASVDSIVMDSSQYNYQVYIHKGPAYTFESLQLDSAGSEFLKKLELEVPKSAGDYLFARKKISEHYSMFGYPFVKVKLDSLKLDHGNINARLKIDEGPGIIMDSIRVHGDVKLRYGYWKNYLNIDISDNYNHKHIISAGEKLRKLTFLELERDPELSFFYNYASLDLYVKKRNSSRFDLLFGVIPTNSIEGKQLFLSLDFTAEMLNRMGYGEYIYIDFERLRPEQQKLEIEFNYPYLLDMPYGLDARFSIFRNGFDYQTINSQLGIQYLINSTDFLKLSWNIESSRLIDLDTTQIRNTRMLPEDLDVDINGIGLEYFLTRLDYKFNPRSGLQLRLNAACGLRTIKRKSWNSLSWK